MKSNLPPKIRIGENGLIFLGDVSFTPNEIANVLLELYKSLDPQRTGDRSEIANGLIKLSDKLDLKERLREAGILPCELKSAKQAAPASL